MKQVVTEQCELLALSQYLMGELEKVGVSCRLERLNELGDGEPLDSLIHLDCDPPKTIALRMHRSGPSAGKLEVANYTGPFDASDFMRVGQDVAARLMAEC